MSISYYPPKGGIPMRFTLTEVALVAIAVALWVAVLFGTNLV